MDRDQTVQGVEPEAKELKLIFFGEVEEYGDSVVCMAIPFQ